jgi:hypothetical protein
MITKTAEQYTPEFETASQYTHWIATVLRPAAAEIRNKGEVSGLVYDGESPTPSPRIWAAERISSWLGAREEHMRAGQQVEASRKWTIGLVCDYLRDCVLVAGRSLE